MMDIKLGNLVACRWLDAHADAKEELGQEAIATMTSYQFTTYGILVRDDRAGAPQKDPIVAVAAEVGEDGRFRGVTFIPAGMVVDVQDLGSPSRRRKAASPKSGRRSNKAKADSDGDTLRPEPPQTDSPSPSL